MVLVFPSNTEDDDLSSQNATWWSFSYLLEQDARCLKLNIIAFLCLLLFLVSLIVNSMILRVFVLHKELLTSANMFIISLTSMNLIGTVIELPWIIVSNFYCRWVFNRFGCVFSAYVMYVIGCSSIMHMCAISFERFYMIYDPLNLRRLNKNVCLAIIGACVATGFFWASGPLFGWSHYSLEGAKTSCAVEWASRSPSVTSYNMTILVFVFLLPLFFLCATNFKLVFLMKKMRKTHENMFTNKLLKKKLALERQLTISAMILISGFIFSWLPYALVAMYTVFIDSNGPVNEIWGTVPAVFAKSSMLWPSVLYILTNQNIRRRIFKWSEGVDKAGSNKNDTQKSKKNLYHNRNRITSDPTKLVKEKKKSDDEESHNVLQSGGIVKYDSSDPSQ